MLSKPFDIKIKPIAGFDKVCEKKTNHFLSFLGVAASGPFKCDLCPATFTLKQNCKRHYINKHGLNQPAAETKVNELKNPLKQCKSCLKFFSRADMHKKYCKGSPDIPSSTGQNPPKKPNIGPGSYKGRATLTARGQPTQGSNRDSPTDAMMNLTVVAPPGVAGPSGVGRSGNIAPSSDTHTNNNAFPSPLQEEEAHIPEILQRFENYCRSTVGGQLAPNSITSYKSAIRQFLRFVFKEHVLKWDNSNWMKMY